MCDLSVYQNQEPLLSLYKEYNGIIAVERSIYSSDTFSLCTKELTHAQVHRRLNEISVGVFTINRTQIFTMMRNKTRQSEIVNPNMTSPIYLARK